MASFVADDRQVLLYLVEDSYRECHYSLYVAHLFRKQLVHAIKPIRGLLCVAEANADCVQNELEGAVTYEAAMRAQLQVTVVVKLLEEARK